VPDRRYLESVSMHAAVRRAVIVGYMAMLAAGCDDGSSASGGPVGLSWEDIYVGDGSLGGNLVVDEPPVTDPPPRWMHGVAADGGRYLLAGAFFANATERDDLDFAVRAYAYRP
jgi:hypothetical protein